MGQLLYIEDGPMLTEQEKKERRIVKSLIVHS